MPYNFVVSYFKCTFTHNQILKNKIIMTNYTTFSDKDLLDITNININKGGIPLKAVQEVQKRGLRKYVNRTVNSHDFDSKGNFIN